MAAPIESLKSPSASFTDAEWRAAVRGLTKTLSLVVPDFPGAAKVQLQSALPTARDLPIPSKIDLSNVNADGLPYWAVESLIQQAGTLLDRAVGTDERHFELAVQRFNARLELCQFFALDEISKRENEAGIFRLPELEANSDKTVLQNRIKGDADLAAFYEKILEKIDHKTFETLKNVAYELAVMNSDLSDRSKHPAENSNLGGQGKPLRNNLATAAMLQVETTFPLQEAQQKADERRFRTDVANNLARRETVDAKANYYTQDTGFKLARREAAVSIMQAKYHAMSAEGGALDYSTQLRNLEERQTLDITQAYRRLLAIDQGLKSIFGTAIPGFPSAKPLVLQDAIQWLRKAHNWLTSLSMTDQAFPLRVSLRAELGDTFGSGIEQGWTLMLPLERFRGQCLVRLRGIAAYAVFENNIRDEFYNLDVRLPADQATIILPSPSFTQSIDQKAVPVCWLRGVSSRALFNQPEIHGAQSLQNCSPIGAWKIKLDDASASKAKGKLRDLQLDFYVVAQPART